MRKETRKRACKTRTRHFGLNEALRHPDHRRPMTRREMIAQGFHAGMGTVVGGSIFSLFTNPRAAYAQVDLSDDIKHLKDNVCGFATQGAMKIPFICIDLAGGANIAGSNVLVGGPDGQRHFLSTAGYSKLGLPGDMVPGTPTLEPTQTSNVDHTDSTLGLEFHSDSQFLRGILEKVTDINDRQNINGAVIAARSENDTGNNPHNPMYGIVRAGAGGGLLDLIGSRSSISGGNSMAPAMMIDPASPPTKIDRPSDVRGLIDTGDLSSILTDPEDVVAVMESIQRITDEKLANVSTGLAMDAALKENASCQHVKSAFIAAQYSNPAVLDPEADPDIVGPSGIFSTAEFNSDNEFRKTASVMKMVIDGFAGAGTITMGGYDYHTGDRATGEARDLRAGRCMGACLEYAARKGVPLMLYVFSDGSVFSNGMIDNSDSPDNNVNLPGGRDKGVWTGDNSSTAASFFLVYDPSGSVRQEANIRTQQIGWMRPDASVETAATPAANNVNLLVETVVLNYMALHSEESLFNQPGYFPSHGLGTNRDNYIAFNNIVTNTI